MNQNHQDKNRVFRDGVSQKDRFLAELDPNYISVDERDKKDWLEFAQKFAEQLKFYDESNQVKGDWSPFFAGDVEEMVAYINNPESFADDEAKLNKLAQPHLVLFFTFLELLRYPQQQFKELTLRYLNFYYKDVLKLREKEEVADKVHTIFELDSREKTHLIKKGTLLNAGQDSEGVDLNYAVDEDIVINQAQVASIKKLFIERQKRKGLEVQEREIKIKNILANSIVDVASGKTIKVPRFSLAPNNNINLAESQKHPIGFAIASPLLNLKEGKRSIVLTLACDKNSLDTDDISNIRKIIQENKPFEVYLSSKTEWIKIESPVVQLGDPIVESKLESDSEKITINLNHKSVICTAEKDLFKLSDVNKYLVFHDGKVYKITKYDKEKEVTVEIVGKSPDDKIIKKYSINDIYLNSYSLQFQIKLPASLPAIAPLNSDELKDKIAAHYPAIKIVLKPTEKDGRLINCYEQLKSICLEKVNIQVTASNVKDIQLRNDSSVLDSKSSFQPFGNNPKIGSSFYFSNSEIISKKLESLTLNMQWMGLPKDFKTHYYAYSVVLQSLNVENQKEQDISSSMNRWMVKLLKRKPSTKDQYKGITNDSFKAKLQLFSKRSWIDIEDKKAIFSQENNNLLSDTTLNYSNLKYPDNEPSNTNPNLDTDDPFEDNSYFKLELQNQDFEHDLYPTVLNKVALATDKKIKSLTVYPPYTPELKTISLDYTASEEINLGKSDAKSNTSEIFQLHPFGYINSPTEGKNYLLPQFPVAAALYIGFRNLQPPQNLSILFQMVSESGNVELPAPQITWSYLNGNKWQNFPETELLVDSTNELLNTGIVRFSIPKAANSEHQLLPTGLYWLRATVNENPTAIPDILDIKTQAVQATYINQGNAPEHLTKPLPSNSIQSFVERESAIKTIQQPYTSFGGEPKENNRAYITRISERLRHKQRAITPWDYERLVLAKFPQIYKAKCISAAKSNIKPRDAPVTIVVIPDISNTAPFFPLEPKVPNYLLKEIEEYVKKNTSPFVQLTVKNPSYERIQYRVGISLRQGRDEGEFLNKLNYDLRRFLSPWAYDSEADISFGTVIYSSTVIKYIQTRPYIDYISNFEIIEPLPSETEQRLSSKHEKAQVKKPDAILVSAHEHYIELMKEESVYGIGYMIIGKDFFIFDEK